jgi:acylphosphatase
MNTAARQVRVVYSGDVQGVGFRYTTRGLAHRLNVTGGVENLPDGTVRLVAEGPEDVLMRLLMQIRVSRLGAQITHEEMVWGDPKGLTGFYYR